MSLSCTIFLVVNETKKQDLLIYSDTLNKCGVKYELFTCNKSYVCEKTKSLKPNKAFTNQNNISLTLNQAVCSSTTDYILFINTPFICEANWLKEYLQFFETSEADCLIVPYLDNIDKFVKSEYLNPFGEILDIQIADNSDTNILGMHLFKTSTFLINGGFVSYNFSPIDECLIHYRKKCENVIVYNQFLKNIYEQNFTAEINQKFLQKTPVRNFSPSEEIAFHNLDVFFLKTDLKAQKFMFDFLGVFGFRCEGLNKAQLISLLEYSKFYDLNIDVQYISAKQEKRIRNNIFVVLKRK